MRYRKCDCRWLTARFPWEQFLFLELGAGLRNGVIKRMLAQVANACEHATYIVVNYSQAMVPDASCEMILVEGDMAPASSR